MSDDGAARIVSAMERAQTARTAEKAPREHGGDLRRLHQGENPYGASPAAYAAAASELAQINRYPDMSKRELIAEIAAQAEVAEDRVAVGNGTDELILLAVLALNGVPGPGVITDVAFTSYPESLKAAGRDYVTCRMEKDYGSPTESLAAQLRRRAQPVFVCNPHNPLGGVINRDHVDTLCQAAVDHQATVVFDEA